MVRRGGENPGGRGRKVLVAMSGGVDSSVSAYLLKKQGCDVAGITMRLGVNSGEEERSGCCNPDAVADAKRVCDWLGVHHRVVDYGRELEAKVIKRFVDEYRRGRTPNPCVDCNRHLKFGILLEEARAQGYDFLATGHYARIEEQNGGFVLKRPKDRRKDQTYFLYAIARRSLGSILFPLSDSTKQEVRDMAKKAGLPVAAKEESQDICFITQENYGSFLAQRVGNVKPGPVTDLSGRKLGEHRGIMFYTVGQRGGLGISAKSPLYVVFIDARENRIVVGGKDDVRAKGLLAGSVNFFKKDWPPVVYGKVRYRKKEAPCRAQIEDGKLKVLFDEEQEAVTPGQSVVLYDGDTVIGGGIIEKVLGGRRFS